MGRSKELKRGRKNAESFERNSSTFHIVENSDFGRYLVASKNLHKSANILTEDPLVVGPCQDSNKLICIGCYITLDNKMTFWNCKECGWPLCSNNCSGFHQSFGHSLWECDLLKRSLINKGCIDYPGLGLLKYLDAITPLRCLALKEVNEPFWSKIQSMQSHDEFRMKNCPNLWTTNQEKVVDVIRKTWGLADFSEHDIHNICGILEVNAFEVNSRGPNPLRALYPTSFLFSHDCVPNVRHVEGANYKLSFYNTVYVSKNERLTVTYTYILQGTLLRQRHLKRTKFFDCCCQRCADVTEFGTYTSALKCPLCKDGYVLPTNPLNSNSEWKCTRETCHGFQISAEAVASTIDKMAEELDAINGNDIFGYETFLRKHSVTLHENHFLCLSALYNLCQLYGKIHGFLISELSQEQLNRKISICRILLKTLDKIDPGLTKTRGIILYELQAPLVILIQQSQLSSKKELKKKFNEVCSLLEESREILHVEPEETNEGEMAKAATDALTNLNSWLGLM